MSVLGIDIGGANIKAAHTNGWTHHEPFAVWREPTGLPSALQAVLSQAPRFDRLAVTMTAELCDCFETKRAGVLCVLDAVQKAAKGSHISIWTTSGRFVSIEEARELVMEVAAANWHALATWLAMNFARDIQERDVQERDVALLVDCGSTTTDVIAIGGGGVLARGRTDTQRLEHGELVYIGARRTPLMVFGPAIEWDGRRVAMMNEYFATMDDVMLVLGFTTEQSKDCDTADGRPRTVGAAKARLARMIGSDGTLLSAARIHELAQVFYARAVDTIGGAVEAGVRAHQASSVIVCGSGEVLALAACERLEGDVEVRRLSQRLSMEVSACAPAYGLAMLGDDDR